MAEVIQLESFKRKQAASRGFRTWSKRFGEKLDEQTRLSDLSDKTLAFLISPGDQNIFAIYELVMGVKNLGSAADFFELSKKNKMEVLDISIHLLDQLRFESMRRLSWLVSGVEQHLSVVEIIERSPQMERQRRGPVPRLSNSHQGYQKYQELSDFDKETFIRKLIPEAIEEFKKMLQE